MLTLITLVTTNKIFTNNHLIINSNNINLLFLGEQRDTCVYQVLSGDPSRIRMCFLVETRGEPEELSQARGRRPLRAPQVWERLVAGLQHSAKALHGLGGLLIFA